MLQKRVYTIMLAFLVSCSTYDYTAFNKHKPKSILVLPPFNNSVEVNAPYIYLSRITKPLAEKGYYVFPVAFIDKLMKENGAPDSASMHEIPLKKIKKIINPDAVLYVTIEDWGQKYYILSSNTVVSVTAKLIDTKTGTLIWEGEERTSHSNSEDRDNSKNPLADALISQVINSTIIDKTPEISDEVNKKLFWHRYHGIPNGPYKISK